MKGPQQQQGNGRIAVIDDEDRWLKVFERMFRNSGWQVETFSDPAVFLRRIGAEPDRYAGVICDIKMPGISGLEVFEVLKGNPSTADVPFVLISGVLAEDHNLAKVQGIAHISKLEEDLKARVFDELIEIIAYWPELKQMLQHKQVPEEDIEFFHQFYVNYHLFFGRLHEFVRQMEAACVAGDDAAAEAVRAECRRYMDQLQERCLSLVELAEGDEQAGRFAAKVCARARNCLNMVTGFQTMLADAAPADSAFPGLLEECRDILVKIIQGTEAGYDLRSQP